MITIKFYLDYPLIMKLAQIGDHKIKSVPALNVPIKLIIQRNRVE